MADLVLMAQPLLALTVFASVLGGHLPLWLSWAVALTPLPVRLWKTGRLFEATPFDIPILLFLVGAGIGVIVAPDRSLGFVAAQSYIACMLLFYGLTSNANLGPKYWWGVGAITTLVVLGFSVITFAEASFGGSGGSRVVPLNSWLISLLEPLPKFDGWFGNIPLHNNMLGMALGIGLPALAAIAILGKGPHRITAGVLGAFSFALLLLSMSGVGWLSATVGLLFVGFCALGKRAYVIPVVLLPLGSLAYMAWDRVFHLRSLFPWTSVTSRVDIWEAGLTLMKDHPWFGVGLGQYVSVSPILGYTPHNAYLLLYGDAGLFGLLALVVAAGVTLWLGWQVLRFTIISAQSPTNPWYAVGVGTLAALLAGAAVSVLESSTAKTWIDAGGTARYVALPGVWFWAALLVVAHRHLYPSGSSQK